MTGKVTKELLGMMVNARQMGRTYQEIEHEFGFSRWVSIHYLKNIKKERGLADELWKQAEIKAERILGEKGFQNILNLNRICPQSYFDYYGTLKDEKWLIDATINESKDLANKSLRMIDGFNCAVLYISHDLTTYRFVKLQEI
jgi:hypothetical protein